MNVRLVHRSKGNESACLRRPNEVWSERGTLCLGYIRLRRGKEKQKWNVKRRDEENIGMMKDEERDEGAVWCSDEHNKIGLLTMVLQLRCFALRCSRTCLCAQMSVLGLCKLRGEKIQNDGASYRGCDKLWPLVPQCDCLCLGATAWPSEIIASTGRLLQHGAFDRRSSQLVASPLSRNSSQLVTVRGEISRRSERDSSEVAAKFFGGRSEICEAESAKIAFCGPRAERGSSSGSMCLRYLSAQTPLTLIRYIGVWKTPFINHFLSVLGITLSLPAFAETSPSQGM